MAALTVDFRKHSGPTPADDMAAQIITDCGNFTLDFKQHGFCASPLFLQTLGPWFPNEMQNLLSSEKRTLDHWATVQFFFSTAQGRCFWRCLWFRSGLVALFLKTSERGDSWCTDSSFSPLLVKLSQVFESALLDSRPGSRYEMKGGPSDIPGGPRLWVGGGGYIFINIKII